MKSSIHNACKFDIVHLFYYGYNITTVNENAKPKMKALVLWTMSKEISVIDANDI